MIMIEALRIPQPKWRFADLAHDLRRLHHEQIFFGNFVSARARRGLKHHAEASVNGTLFASLPGYPGTGFAH